MSWPVNLCFVMFYLEMYNININIILIWVLSVIIDVIMFILLSLQIAALIAQESQTQTVDELCVVSQTPRTLQTLPPPSPPTSPPPLSRLMPLALHPLTIGSALPPLDLCSLPAVWGPHWRSRRGAAEPVKRDTGSGWAAAHRASRPEDIGGSRTSARGHSSWFCMAATSSWCEEEEGKNASRLLIKCRTWRRESPELDVPGHKGHAQCLLLLSEHPPPPMVQSELSGKYYTEGDMWTREGNTPTCTA